MNILQEIKAKIKKGYKGELLYNYRSGNYEITTWKEGKVDEDRKVYKIPRGTYTPNDLKEATYGKDYEKWTTFNSSKSK